MLSLTAIILFVYVFEIDRNGSYELIVIQSKEMHPKLEIINKKMKEMDMQRKWEMQSAIWISLFSCQVLNLCA